MDEKAEEKPRDLDELEKKLGDLDEVLEYKLKQMRALDLGNRWLSLAYAALNSGKSHEDAIRSADAVLAGFKDRFGE